MAMFLSLVFGSSVYSADVPSPPAIFHSVGVGGGGALYNLSFNPKDSAESWMETDMGELFHTLDNGATWTYPDLDQVHAYHESRVQWTNIQGTIYVQDYNGIPKKSVDAGKTWTTLGGWDYAEQLPCKQLRVDRNDANRVWGVSDKGLFYSSNGGRKFRKIWDNPGDRKMYMSGLFTDGARLWVGTTAGVLTSADGGTTWTRIEAAGIPADVAIASFAGAKKDSTVRLWAVALEAKSIEPNLMDGQLFSQSKGVYRLTVGDATWTEVTAKLPKGHLPVFVGLADDNPDVVWLGGAERMPPNPAVPSMLRSTDGGESWSSKLILRANTNVYTNWYGDGMDHDWPYAGSVFTMSISASNPNHSAFTNLFGAWGTFDGGDTWRSLVADMGSLNKPGVTQKPNAFYSSTLNNTASWYLQWLDDKTIFASSNDITAFRSIDGGKTWQFPKYIGSRFNATYKTTYDAQNGILYAAMSDAHDLYFGLKMADEMVDGLNGGIDYSTDKGASWKPLRAFTYESQGKRLANPVLSVALDPKVPHRMYALVGNHSNGGVYRTDDLDKGEQATWTKMANPPRTEGHPWHIEILNDGALVVTYAGRVDEKGKMTESSGVFVSADAGETWEDRTAPASQSSMRWNTQDIVIDPRDPAQNTWYACVDFVVYLPDAWPEPKVGLFKTTDRGRTWKRVFSEIRVGARSAVINAASNEIYLATGAGLWYAHDGNKNGPKFTKVPDMRFPTATRVFLNPFKPSEVWVVTLGGGIMWGDAAENPKSNSGSRRK